MEDFRDNFDREVEKMKKLINEFNVVLKENNIPMSEDEKLELQEKINALASLGGLLKTGEGAVNATIMVMAANKAIEYMLKDLRYVGPTKIDALENDDDLNGLLDFFGVERMEFPPMPPQQQNSFNVFVDEDGEEYIYEEYIDEDDEEYIDDRKISFDSIIKKPESERYASFDSKNQTINIHPEKAPKRDTIEDFIRKMLEDDDNKDL